MSVVILTVDEVMRTLSNDGQYPFVEKDKTVDIVRFALNTGFTDVVLDEYSALRVMYQRPGETEVRAQTLTYHDTDGLRNYYDWQLLSADLSEKGTLTVALCILRTDGDVEEWHTTPCQIRVLDTIHTDDSDEGDETITPTVTERVAVLESMMQRVASGAPIVVASTSAMTDTNQIYVLSTNGRWYYHNGSAWVEGGTYGAAVTDTTLSVAGAPADSKVVGDAVNSFEDELSSKVRGAKGNNIFDIPDYEGSRNGMAISIKNNRITLNGTATKAIRMKLTHGIDVQDTEQVSWADESLSDMFEIGKQYCIAYKVYSGIFDYAIGTPARISKTPSVSFLSVTVPKNIATADNMPHYIMLYVPINTTADVTFEPFFMEAYTQNDMFSYDVFDNVKVTSKLTPKNQYNYFTVSINTSNDDSSETIQSVNAVVTFPETYKAQGEKTPLIMYCHGRADTVSVGDWVENDTKRRTLIESFVSGGYAVFDVDAISHPSGGAVDVGSPAIMQAYIKAWEYIKEHYNVEDKLFIYSLSFGTFVALNMLSWYPSAIRTACLSAIRASHRAVFNRGTPFNTQIAANFGFEDSTGATYEADKMLGFDPYADISDGKLIKSISPIKAFTSSGDTQELNEARTLISAWKAGGNYINYREVSGLNHSDMCYLADEGLRNEVITWFNRYR